MSKYGPKQRKLFAVKKNSKSTTTSSEGAQVDPRIRMMVDRLPGVRRFLAGNVAPVAGVYRVYHREHRLPHSVFIAAGEVMPPCRVCGTMVEYGLLMSAGEPVQDPDLGESARKVG